MLRLFLYVRQARVIICLSVSASLAATPGGPVPPHLRDRRAGRLERDLERLHMTRSAGLPFLRFSGPLSIAASGSPFSLERGRDPARRSAFRRPDWRPPAQSRRHVAQSLERRFLLVDQRDDDIARLSRVLLTNDDGVVLENAGVDHGIATNLESIMLATSQKLGRHRQGLETGLDGRDRGAGGDAAHHRHHHSGSSSAIARRRGRPPAACFQI